MSCRVLERPGYLRTQVTGSRPEAGNHAVTPFRVFSMKTTPNFLALEYHASDVPFWNDLIEGQSGPLIQDGYISVPDRPGFGVTLNEEVARRYARADEPFFE